ncbi:outer membrane lipoprotein carrier protein LolA [Planctomycetota bacterium]
MRPADSIKDLFEQARIQADADQTERILGDALQELKKRSPSQGVRKRPSRWRLIMSSKTTQFSTAAVVLLALGLFLVNFNEPMVYGMSEVPALYKQAKTLHFKGTRYFVENNSSKSAEMEYWIDKENKQWRILSPSYSVMNEEVTVSPVEQVYDGNGLVMMMDHTAKQLVYFRLSPLKQALEERLYLEQLYVSAFGDASNYDAYEIVGAETVDGIHCEIWEAVITQHSSFTTRTRTWLDPLTGNLHKSETWLLGDQGDWQLFSELHTTEHNIAIPEQVFSLDPLAGYEAMSTPETADPMPNRQVMLGNREGNLMGYLLFAMPDGSLIACWSCTSKESSESQQALFANLRPGGVFPELPYQVHEIKVLLDEEEYVFAGCHLASTQKDGQFYEWGLYVSKSGVPNRRFYKRGFLMDYRPKSSGQMWMIPNAVVETAVDFKELVLAAMTEFSDKQDAPELTLKDVLELAADKRSQ